jgi:hypothetical protein
MSELTALGRDERGILHASLSDGSQHAGVIAVRAFPVRAPDEAISILDGQGQEVCWIEHLPELAPALRTQVGQALQSREFMPEIVSIRSVSGFITPCTWFITTDRGDTELLLKGDEDIRRVAGNTLLITDSHGIHFLIRDVMQLSRESRKLLDRFM